MVIGGEMKKNIWILGFFVMSLYGFILFSAYAQEGSLEINQPENWQEISGKVENLDVDTSMIVIKVYSDEAQTSYRDVTVLITKEAKIVKDGKDFSLQDLKSGDEISVRYIVTANGQKEAYYLWVK
jgi:hypothetical protein